MACYNGHHKVVQVLLDHGVQVGIRNKVSDISCIRVKLCSTTEVNKASLVTKENDIYVLLLFSYDYNHGISLHHTNFQ